MSRSVRRTGPAVVLLLVIAASASFRAQSSSTHTLTFVELSYGNSISGLARDASGGVWFAGQTCSSTLPTTTGAFQPSAPASACNGMFGRMTSDGAVTYLSYLGGSRESRANAIAIDSAGNVYVAGYTFATDFPTTAGAYDRTCGSDGTCMYNKLIAGHPSTVGTRDGFVTKLTPAADRLIYSTYIGGQDDDAVSVIAVDAGGRVHLGGRTISADFPVTAGAIQSSFSFGADPDENYFDDAYYARLSADGSSLEYSTYLGGAGEDSANAIVLGGSGDAFLVGTTGSPDFPTVNPVQPTFGDRLTSPPTGSDAFVTRFSSSGPVYSTFMGGSSSDTAGGVALVGNTLYVAGSTCSTDFPGGGSSTSCHTFLSELAASNAAVNRTMLLQGTNGFDKATALAVDANHVAYIGGSFTGFDGVSGSFPTTADAYQRAYSAGWDAFFSIVDMSAEPSLVYSTLLGGGKDESIAAVLLDGNGGAFFAGSSGLANGAPASGTAPFPSHTTNTEPPAEGVSQSFAAHVGVSQGTTGGTTSDVVLYARDATAVAGTWQFVADSSAAGGTRLWNPDAGVAKISTPAGSPANYFDLTFNAQAGVPYHLWLRLKADSDSYQNDSVWVQFSDSVDANGSPIWRTGTTTGTSISLEDCSGCGEQGWGWNDNGYGTAGTPVYFAATGTHTIRIQQREDGISIDQIILSSATWATTAPGANKNDTTIVPQGSTASNQPPTVSITSPTNGATYTAPATVTVGASASDSDGTVSKVDFYANGSLIGSANASPFSIMWHDVGAGTYNLTAVATDNQGATTTSAAVSITVSGASTSPFSGWRDHDIGDTGAQGSAVESPDGTVTQQGAGADVWGTSDALNYLYTPLSADGAVTVQVTSVSDESNWVKAGVMIRSSLDPSAAQAFILVSHAKGVAFQRRTTDGGTTVSTSGSAFTAPRWIRLVRTGATISGYESADGSNWTLVGSDTFNLPHSMYIGLAVSSHVPGTLATATFRTVQITGTVGIGDADVGDVPFTGSWSASGNTTWSVTGSGADIWGTADAFHYTYWLLDGNATITTRVATVENVADWVKAGVMIRETLAPDSPHAFVLVSAAKGVAFQRRDAPGGTSVSTAGSASAAPHWVKLTRNGDTFTAYESVDGTTWTLIGSDTIPMGGTAYIGLAVTSHSTSASATCTFDHVSIQ